MSQDRILIYAINGTGMGHLNRTLVLARAAREYDASVEILFAVASPMFGLVANAGFPVIKVLDRSHALGAHACCSNRKFHLNAVFEPLIQSFRPSAFVVDLTIDARLFRTASEAGARVAAILRKPRPSALWGLALDPGSRGVDRFLLPHPEEEFAVQDLPLNLRGRGRQLGAVVKTINPDRVQAMTAKYKHGSRPLVVAAVGGGGYDESRRTVAVVEEAAALTPQLDWVIIYGPFFSEQLPSGEGTHVRRLRFEPELFELNAAADVVVCNAGYNTITELETLGRPAIVIPVKGTGRDDQLERAKRFESEGRGFVCGLDVQELRRHLSSIVDERRLTKRVSDQVSSLAGVGGRFLEALS
jgi:predicted glycosyltransferase